MDEAFAHVKKEGSVLENEKRAPDGGWGYAVCFGVGTTCMLGFGATSAFGILFNNFFLEQGGATGLTLVIGVYSGALSITGFLTGIALKRYTFRQVGLVGAALFVLGDILTIFVTKTYHLVLSFGLLRGAGFGITIHVSYAAFNCYFNKKRIAMMSANQSISSIGSITFPLLVTFLLAEYDFRGTLALIMALDLHILVAMLVMHPVEWHLVDNCQLNSVDASQINIEKGNSDTNCDESLIKIFSIDTFKDEDLNKKKIKYRYRNLQKTLLKKICDNVDLHLLKDPKFVSVLLGIGFAFVSDVSYLALEPMLLFSYGFTKMQVATCVMVGAVADLLARFLLAVFTYFFVVDSRKVFFGGTLITIFLRIAIVSWSELWFVFLITAISGLVRCTVQVLFPLVLASAAPDKFSDAFAIHILFSGLLMLTADPLIGVIYEASGSYFYSFIAMSGCCLICVVMWTIEYLIYRKKKKTDL